MNAQVLSFFRPAPFAQGDWSQQELAEFYRVEAATTQAGLRLVTDRGLTDEGDPWFVFCRAEKGEVFIHFARYDGQYIISAEAMDGVLQGSNFRALLTQFTASNPAFLQFPRQTSGATLLIHPAALLAAIVASACLLGSGQEVVAGELLPQGDHWIDPASVSVRLCGPEEVSVIGSGQREYSDGQNARRAEIDRKVEIFGVVVAAATIAMALSQNFDNNLHTHSDPLLEGGGLTAVDHGQAITLVEAQAGRYNDDKISFEAMNANSEGRSRNAALSASSTMPSNEFAAVIPVVSPTQISTGLQLLATSGALEGSAKQDEISTILLKKVDLHEQLTVVGTTGALATFAKLPPSTNSVIAEGGTAPARLGSVQGLSTSEDNAALGHINGQEVTKSSSSLIGSKTGLITVVTDSDMSAGHLGSGSLSSSTSTSSTKSVHVDDTVNNPGLVLANTSRESDLPQISNSTDATKTQLTTGSNLTSTSSASFSTESDQHSGYLIKTYGVDASSFSLSANNASVWSSLLNQIATLQRGDVHGSATLSTALEAGVGNSANVLDAAVSVALTAGTNETISSHQASTSVGSVMAPTVQVAGSDFIQVVGKGLSSAQAISSNGPMPAGSDGIAHTTPVQESVAASSGITSVSGALNLIATAGSAQSVPSQVVSVEEISAARAVAAGHSSNALDPAAIASGGGIPANPTLTLSATTGSSDTTVQTVFSATNLSSGNSSAGAAGKNLSSEATSSSPPDIITLRDDFFKPLSLDQIKFIDAFISSTTHLRLDIVDRTLIVYDSEPQVGLTVPVTTWDLGQNVTLSLVGIPASPLASHT